MGTLKVSGNTQIYGSANSYLHLGTDGSISTILKTTGGWARGWYFNVNDTIKPCFGMYGGADGVNWFYLGTGYEAAKCWMKVTPAGAVTATKFVGALEGNATSATYLGTSVASDNANRHVYFAYNGDAVGKQRAVVDDDFKYNPSTNVLTVGSISGSAAKLTTARAIRTNLASTSTASFDGSANVTPGVTGTLPVGNGGTGATTFSSGYLLLGNGTSAITTKNIHVNYSAGTTSAVGYEELVIGNSTSSGTAGNTYGRLALYSQKSAGVYLVAADTTSWSYTNTLPAVSGTLLNTGNYTSYTVKKDGTGASGTWGISISGNAATATTASAVAWANVSGKPSSYTPAAHTNHATLTITSTSATGHLNFSRAGISYITAPASGYIGFSVNGQGNTLAVCDLVVNNGQVYPGSNNATELGTSGYRWSAIHTQRIHCYSTTDVAATAANNTGIIVGLQTGEHIEIDNNEIMAKSNGTTASTLYLNSEGGSCYMSAATIAGPLYVAHNSITVGASTVGANAYASDNPHILFRNSDASQTIKLMFTDYDAVVGPASLTLVGNQGGEHLIVPKLATANYGTGDPSGNAVAGTVYFKLTS